MSGPKKESSSLLSLIPETLRVYSDKEMNIYAGNTTLYILMAMVPMLSLLIGVVNLLPDVSLQALEEAVLSLLPNVQELRSLTHNVITNVNRKAGTLAISISAVATLWSASNGVNAIQLGLRKLCGADSSAIHSRLKSLLYTLLFIALIPALFVSRVLRGSIEELLASLNRLLNIPDVVGRVMDFIEYSGIAAIAATLIVVLLSYTYLSGAHRKLKLQFPGALFTTLLWLIFSDVFEIFISEFWQASSLYGSLASIFLTAMWLKTIMMIFFYGASLNEALERRRIAKRRVTPPPKPSKPPYLV